MGKLRYGGVTDFLRWFVGLVCAFSGLLLIAACGHESRDEMSWARAALERNTSLEIVAADQQSRTFTVRLKDNGELRMVRADEVVASPAAAAPVDATHAKESKSRTALEATPGEPAVARADASTGAEPARPAEANPAEETIKHSEPLLTSESSTSLASVAPGRVLESGPGYTISAAQASAPAAARTRESASSAPVERRHEPIVCQGSRLLHIDNRNLIFDGDAVSALDGCEIHITNSHISARGIGVAARAANVHIDNSQIEGDQASIDASDGAQVYAASSHFKGLSRRLDTAAVHDLGGNIWN
jgi:hypothetical protein